MRAREEQPVRAPRWVLRCGQLTMPIFVLHILFIAGTRIVAMRLFPGIDSGALLVALCTVGLAGPIAVHAVARRLGVARALAREWGPAGVRVNCVAPLAATPAMEQAFLDEPAMAERVLGRNPLGRLGDAADDIGPVVRFLLSDDARYVNGGTVMADGASCPVT